MNKHVERAKQLRDTAPQSNNCAQTIMRAYAEEMGLTEEQAAAIGCNFGGGMKCGGTCGAITRRTDGSRHQGRYFTGGSWRISQTHGAEAQRHDRLRRAA